MKKIVLVAMAMLAMTSAFADNEKDVESVASAHKYVIEVNAAKISRALGLSVHQYDDVANGEETFASETRAASRKKTEEARQEAFTKAVKRNMKYMHGVLTQEQYHTYLMLLNTTLANRGLSL